MMAAGIVMTVSTAPATVTGNVMTAASRTTDPATAKESRPHHRMNGRADGSHDKRCRLCRHIPSEVYLRTYAQLGRGLNVVGFVV